MSWAKTKIRGNNNLESCGNCKKIIERIENE
jgi:hypothetical protein